MLFDLLGQQMFSGNAQLFFFRVAGHFDDLQTVQQRPGNGVHGVGGGDEHDLAQVEGQLHVVVAESEILLRVQHFQQRGGGVAPEIAAHFVDLVKQEHRVHGARLLDTGDDPTGDRAYIGAPVAANLGLVPHAAQRHLHKFAPHGLRHRPDDGGFTHAGRADEAQDRALHVLLHAQHGQILDDALLHLFQSVVILIQNAPGPLQIQIIRGGLAPGQVEDPLHVGAADADLRRAGSHVGQAFQLFFSLLPGFIVQGRFFQLLAKLLHIGAVLVAQLSLNGLDLLPQVIILLVALDLLLDAGLHLLFHVSQLRLPQQDAAECLQPVPGLELFQNGLTVFQTGQHVGGDHVRQLVGLLHFQHRVQRLLGHPHTGLAVLFKVLLRRAHQRLHFGAVLQAGVHRGANVRHHAGFFLGHLQQNGPLQALHQHPDAVARQVQRLLDHSNGAYPAKIVPGRVVILRILLGDQKNFLVAGHRFFQRGYALGSAYVKMQHHMGEYHHSPKGQHRHTDGSRPARRFHIPSLHPPAPSAGVCFKQNSLAAVSGRRPMIIPAHSLKCKGYIWNPDFIIAFLGGFWYISIIQRNDPSIRCTSCHEKEGGTKLMKKKCLALFLIVLMLLSAVPAMAEGANPAAWLKTDEQRASVATLTDVNDGKLYTMDYTADYQLDALLEANVTDVEGMVRFLQKTLLAGGTASVGAVDAGCSAFTAQSEEGKFLYGRNFDYKMDMTAVLVRTAPENGYRSIGLANVGWIGYTAGTLNDGITDLSMAAFFPYLLMDGMNEKGLAMSVLKLRGDPTLQDTGKNKISTTVALRLVLDRAATVDEALKLLDEYDMQSSMPEANFHFLLADASGKAVVLEYLPNGQRMVYDQNYVTNFYLTENVPYAPVRGKDRYDLIEQTLIFKKGVMSEAEVMALLAVIGQPETEEATSMTQWSVVYNLTDLTGRVAVVREYDNVFRFSLDGMIQP